MEATPHHIQIISFAIIKLFLLFNTRGKMKLGLKWTIYRKYKTRFTIYEQTHYWILEFLHELEFVYKYFVIQNIKILWMKPKLTEP